jgi:ribosomal-protein-alanine N-acetyltransferase
MDLSQTQIETERLRLVPKSEDFAKQIFLEYRDPVIQYMNYGPPESLEILTERLKNSEAEMKRGEQLFMVVLLKETGEFLGCMALEDLKEKNPEMGGWLKKSAHGHGYGREAAAALKQWAEEHLEYEHILWPCAVENASSCKLAELLGGKVHREYEKTTARGTTWLFKDYWIQKNDEK